MDNPEYTQFPIEIIRDVDGSDTYLEPYLLYNNMAEAALDLLKGPPQRIFIGDKDWSIPMSNLEAAMYLLRPEHLAYLRQRLLDIPIEDSQFFLLIFLLCANPGKYSFGTIYDTQTFVGKHEFEIYKEISGSDVPRGEYTLTPVRRLDIYEAFKENNHMYYFLIYSRRVIGASDTIDTLEMFREDKDGTLNNYVSTYPDFDFPDISVENNIDSMLFVEYYQNYDTKVQGVFSMTSLNINDLMKIDVPQHKSRRQLVKMYTYLTEDFSLDRKVPKFVKTPDNTILIQYEDGNEEVTVGNMFDLDGGYLPYYISALASKLRTEKDDIGDLGKLTRVYQAYRYGIDYIQNIINPIPGIWRRQEYLEGIAAYHLLYQCMSGRTSKYIDLQNQNLSHKYAISTLMQRIERNSRKSAMLRIVPFYEESTIIQQVYSLKNIQLEYSSVEIDEIDNTIGIICTALGVSDMEYAHIINSIIEELNLHEHFGVIKTTIKRPKLDRVGMLRLCKRMNLIADFQGRNPLVMKDITYASYDDVNSLFRLNSEGQENDNLDEEDMLSDYYDEDEF